MLRKQLQTLAKQMCRDKTEAFGRCAQEKGMMVVFSCRKENREMSDCMDTYYNEAEFQKFALERGYMTAEMQKKFNGEQI